MTAQTPTVMPDLCSRRMRFHYTTALMTLMKLGVDIDQVDILAGGEHENYRGEIWDQEPKPGTVLDSRTRIRLTAGFSSAVDIMPYQFFYGLEGVRESTGEWETRARKLMAAFDAAVIRRLARADHHAMKYNLGLIEVEHLSRYLRLFNFDFANEADDLREAIIWTSLFPTFHFWAGNPGLVASILNCIFSQEFEIVENVEAEFEIPEKLRYRLGDRSERLGQGTILGKSFIEQDSRYRVIVRGVGEDEIPAFLPGEKKRVKLEKILGICMPGYLEYEIKVTPKTARSAEAGGYRLGASSQRGYLGYTTHTRSAWKAPVRAN